MPYTREQLNMTFRRISSGGIASLPRKLLRRKVLQITKGSGNISAGNGDRITVFLDRFDIELPRRVCALGILDSASQDSRLRWLLRSLSVAADWEEKHSASD